MGSIRAKVAVANAAYSFDALFDYAVPAALLSETVAGVRVLVPFGNGNKKRQGFVFSVFEGEDSKKCKEIAAVLDEAPLLTNEMLHLAAYLKEHTFCTYFDAAKAMLPSGMCLDLVVSYIVHPELPADWRETLSADEQSVIRYLSDKGEYVKSQKLLKDLGFAQDFKIAEHLAEKGYLLRNLDTAQKIGDATVKMARLTPFYMECEDTKVLKLTKKQKEIVSLLEDLGCAAVKEICYFTGLTAAVVSALSKKGVIELFENEVLRRPKRSSERTAASIELTEEQQTAYENLLRQYQSEKAEGALLFGVTGSGKTQVFLKLIDAVIAENRGVIVMVPEISLTPQMLAIFYGRYGDNVAVFHSGLSMGERMDEWKRVKRGEAKIVLGTRSAVFAPLTDIGLIVMDEEHEHTYKSEMSPRYHAREVAKYRIGMHKGLLLLASATPSLESYTLAKQGVYSLQVLKNRYGKAVLPDVITADVSFGDDAALKNISSTLADAINENIENGRQSILLLNRRGYNTFAACTACGKVKACPNCSISLTYHAKNNRLMCHYCGYSEPFTQVCKACGEQAMSYSGMGTQRLEEELAELFPKAKVLRLDTDTASSRYAFENSLKKFTEGEYNILVGTQMVAKGLDFPNVTLVGVLSVDRQLYNDDYKSAERTFDLLTQVVGRSGRGEHKGRAIIQTAFPENDIIRLARKQAYEDFYNLEMRVRKALVYPPYCDICVISFTGTDELMTSAAAKCFIGMLRERHAESYKDVGIIALGPIAPRMARVNGKYRYRIIVKCKNNKRLRAMISELLKAFAAQKQFTKITALADINPENIY